MDETGFTQWVVVDTLDTNHSGIGSEVQSSLRRCSTTGIGLTGQRRVRCQNTIRYHVEGDVKRK